MAAFEEVLVSDLNKMSADELRERGVIALKDPENLTAEHMKKLKLLANGLDESRALDVNAVNEKLWNLAEAYSASSRSRFSPSPTPDANDPVLREEDLLDSLYWEHEAYYELVQNGGRPSHRPNDLGFDYLYMPQSGIIWYWITVCPSRECIFQEQRWHWAKFREHQDWRRGRYYKPEWFERFVQEVREYRRKKDLEGDIYLLQDRKEQSRLQDWAEFQYWEYKKADRFVKERERYAREVQEQEERLEAAIKAGQPTETIEMIRDHSLALMEGRRGGAEIHLERQNVLLKWIDEQLPIIASECQTSVNSTPVLKDYRPTSVGTSLGKRKRLTDQTDHVRDYRRRVKVTDSCDPESSPARNAVDRSSRLASPKSQISRMPNTRRRGHRHNKSTRACADDGKAVNLDTSKTVHCKSLPKPTNSSRRSRTRALPVQAQHESRPVRAGLKTSEFRPQSAAKLAEQEITCQKSKEARTTSVKSSKRRSSILMDPQSIAFRRVHSSRVSKTRVRTCAGVSAEAAYGGDARRSSRKGKQKDKLTTARSGMDAVESHRQKQLTSDATVRRSSRLEGKPAVRYWGSEDHPVITRGVRVLTDSLEAA